MALGHNPFGVETMPPILPRVAAARQPWASGQNRFAVRVIAMALLDQEDA